MSRVKIGAVCGIESDHRGGVRFLRRTWIGPLEQNRSTRRDGCKTVPVATCAERSGDRLSPYFRIFVFSTFAPTIGPPRQTPHDRQMLSTSKQLTTPSARPSRRLAFFSEMVGSGRSLTPGSQTPRKFSPHVEAAVTELLPSKRQTLFFTATWPREVQQLARSYLSPNAMQIFVGGADTKLVANKSVTQKFEQLTPSEKPERLMKVIMEQPADAKIVVFCNTKADCAKLEADQKRLGRGTCAIHGDKDQWER